MINFKNSLLLYLQINHIYLILEKSVENEINRPNLSTTEFPTHEHYNLIIHSILYISGKKKRAGKIKHG